MAEMAATDATSQHRLQGAARGRGQPPSVFNSVHFASCMCPIQEDRAEEIQMRKAALGERDWDPFTKTKRAKIPTVRDSLLI